MKKTLIALGVAAGAIAAAQADTTNLYGSLGYSVQVADKDGVDDTIWDLNTATAKFGIKGTEDLSNGLQAFFKFEFGVLDNDEYSFTDTGVRYLDEQSGVSETRYAYLGLKGDFGTLTLGKQDTVWKHATNYNDIFNQVGYAGRSSAPTKAAKVVNYMTPDMSGTMLGASIVLDEDNIASDGIDAYEVGILYDMNGFSAGLGYMYVDMVAAELDPATGNTIYVDDGAQEHIGGHIGYSNDQYQVGFGAQHESSTGTYYNLAGEFYNGPNTFRAGFDYIDNKDADEDLNFALGYQYNFSERTYTWVEADYYDYGDDNRDEDFVALVGIRHDF